MPNLHTTSLGSFLSCPYKYKFDTSEFNYSALDFGTKAHLIMEMTLLGLNKGVDIIMSTCSISDREKINMMVNILKQQIKDKGRELVMGEYKLNYSDDKTRLEGTFDQLFIDKDGQYHMVDLKTAAGEWGEDQRSQQIQCYVYPTMLFNTTSIKCIDFEYWVFTKHSVPRFYTYKFEDVVQPEKLDYWLEQYKNATNKDIWLPNYQSYMCKRCKLGSKCGKYGEVNVSPF